MQPKSFIIQVYRAVGAKNMEPTYGAGCVTRHYTSPIFNNQNLEILFNFISNLVEPELLQI